MQGPKSIICRGACSNYTSFTNDVRAAWQNALMWYITKNQSHWDRSTTILDAWGTNLTNVIGTDTSLLVGLEGDMLVNAAEIMRWEGGWVEEGAKASGGSGFSNQIYWLFARQSIIIGQANYGMISIKALLSYAVYMDDVSMVGNALSAFMASFLIFGSITTRSTLTRMTSALESTAISTQPQGNPLKQVAMQVTPFPASDGQRKPRV